MAAKFSEEDLLLLGYTAATEVSELSGQSQSQSWTVLSATALAGLKEIKHTFAYLKSSCTGEDAKQLAALTRSTPDLYVVVPRSGIGVSIDTVKKYFGKKVQVSIHEDLVWSRIASLFSEYVESLTEIPTEKIYVTPRGEDAKSPRDRLDHALVSYLKGGNGSGRVKIVTASAGVGKTTLARQVVHILARDASVNRVIPTYVEASHWGKLQLESIDDLWEIIDNSLRTFSSSLRIDETLFKHALRQGYLVFIFDGFDELCGQRQSSFDAREVLQWLLDVVKETDARIVITTRTLFWNAEIGEEPKKAEVVALRPFEAPQAKDYFRKYFSKDNRLAEIALQLYKQLIKDSQRPRESGGGRVQFVNLPLCVGMIARYVEEGGEAPIASGEGNIVHQLLYQILERERGRQALVTNAKQQLLAFEQIAVFGRDEHNPDFDLALLEAAGFEAEDVTKLRVHPLLAASEASKFRFSYEFLSPYLRASYVGRAILAGEANSKRDVVDIMSKEANGKSYVVEHLVSVIGHDGLEAVAKAYRNLPVRSEARSFLFHVARMIIDTRDDLVNITERSEELYRVLGGSDYLENRQVKNLYVVGTIDRLDLSGVSICDSTFESTTFLKCLADSSTKFVRCRFTGELDFRDCDPQRWAQVTLPQCTLEPPNNLIWEGMLGYALHGGEDHAMDALRIAMSKFWHHGRLKGSIRKEDWSRGTLGHSIYCKPLLDAMVKAQLISEVHIGGVRGGGYSFARDAIGDLQRFMDNRQLTGKIRGVYEAIKNR